MNRLVCLASLLVTMLVAIACVPISEESLNNEQVQNRGSEKDNWWDSLPREAWSEYRRVKVSSDWFEVYEVREQVFALYEPGQFEEVISWLIVGEKKALLFDTGLGIANIRELVSELTELPLVVLNSHSHYDHVGDNFRFDRVAGLNTAYGSLRSKGLSHADVAEFVGEGWIWKETPGDFVRDAYRIRPWQFSQLVSDGEIFDLGGRRLEVVTTPGHSPDSLCLLDRERRLLFTGDTFYPAPLYTHLPHSDLSKYRDSANKLGSLAPQVDYLLPGHNEPLVPASQLNAMHAAFDSIFRATAMPVKSDNVVEYKFDGFSILASPEALKENGISY